MFCRKNKDKWQNWKEKIFYNRNHIGLPKYIIKNSIETNKEQTNDPTEI